jgi:hypothetical protein
VAAYGRGADGARPAALARRSLGLWQAVADGPARLSRLGDVGDGGDGVP